MRFSVIAGPRQRADLGETAAECWRNYVGDAVLAEELGFDAYCIGEHHFCFAAGNSSPFVMLTEIAAKTSRIRLGTTVICAPFHNPLRLAEDIAALDIASNGRLDLGIGVGSQWEEFQAFGIEPSERFGRTWEIIDIIERCLYSPVDEVFDWNGKYYNFPGVRWVMQPVQERIPIFWGGFGPQGVARAAKRGYHLIAWDITGTFQRVITESGGNPKDYFIGFGNAVSIADTQDEALAASAEPCTWTTNEYALRIDLDGNTPPAEFAYTVDEVIAFSKAGQYGAALPRNPDDPKPPPFMVPIAGTPEDILEVYKPMVRGEWGVITNVCISVREPGTPTKNAHETMRRFAGEVMPVLNEEAAKHGL